MNLLSKLKCFYHGHAWWLNISHAPPQELECARCDKLRLKRSEYGDLSVELLVRRELELRCLLCGNPLGREWTEKKRYHIHMCKSCRMHLIRDIRGRGPI